MNLKNFPKRLDSKTSCLRITVPENLDLALEGLIRKVLKEQPKTDDIYSFAADYFETLLKIRDKTGAKFTAAQLCPFHNDEDAHEMIKLAGTFSKPASGKLGESFSSEGKKSSKKKETVDRDQSKNNVKKTKLTERLKSEKVVLNKQGKSDSIKKKPTAVTTAPEQAKIEQSKVLDDEISEKKTKKEESDDEEFLASDPIKELVEKELMEAKSNSKKEESLEKNLDDGGIQESSEVVSTNKENEDQKLKSDIYEKPETNDTHETLEEESKTSERVFEKLEEANSSQTELNNRVEEIKLKSGKADDNAIEKDAAAGDVEIDKEKIKSDEEVKNETPQDVETVNKEITKDLENSSKEKKEEIIKTEQESTDDLETISEENPENAKIIVDKTSDLPKPLTQDKSKEEENEMRKGEIDQEAMVKEKKDRTFEEIPISEKKEKISETHQDESEKDKNAFIINDTLDENATNELSPAEEEKSSGTLSEITSNYKPEKEYTKETGENQNQQSDSQYDTEKETEFSNETTAKEENYPTPGGNKEAEIPAVKENLSNGKINIEETDIISHQDQILQEEKMTDKETELMKEIEKPPKESKTEAEKPNDSENAFQSEQNSTVPEKDEDKQIDETEVKENASENEAKLLLNAEPREDKKPEIDDSEKLESGIKPDGIKLKEEEEKDTEKNTADTYTELKDTVSNNNSNKPLEDKLTELRSSHKDLTEDGNPPESSNLLQPLASANENEYEKAEKLEKEDQSSTNEDNQTGEKISEQGENLDNKDLCTENSRAIETSQQEETSPRKAETAELNSEPDIITGGSKTQEKENIQEEDSYATVDLQNLPKTNNEGLEKVNEHSNPADDTLREDNEKEPVQGELCTETDDRQISKTKESEKNNREAEFETDIEAAAKSNEVKTETHETCTVIDTQKNSEKNNTAGEKLTEEMKPTLEVERDQNKENDSKFEEELCMVVDTQHLPKSEATDSFNLREESKPEDENTESKKETEIKEPIPDLESPQIITVKGPEKPNENKEKTHPSGEVQIKTIETHYYDTLQVPKAVIKEYRVHSVAPPPMNAILSVLSQSNSEPDHELLNQEKQTEKTKDFNMNDLPPTELNENVTSYSPPTEPKKIDSPTECSKPNSPPLIKTATQNELELEIQKSDSEDLLDLMTPTSGYSLNLSELSWQTVSGLFLDSEKRYSSLEKEEVRYAIPNINKTLSEPDLLKGVESRREVEEIIHKTVFPSKTEAVPVPPREEEEINEESNTETLENFKEKKKENKPENESSENSSDSNNGKSLESNAPVISVEVKTIIETQVLDDEEEDDDDECHEEQDGRKNKEGLEPDVEIKMETTIEISDEKTVHSKLESSEEKNKLSDENIQEQNDFKLTQIQDKNQNDKGTEDNSTEQTSGREGYSGESDSTSSAATEIKRTDSIKRNFSSTRSLLLTQSLDFGKKNPLIKTRSLSTFRHGVTDFEVWSTIEKELEEAATKIQSKFRGYKTRKKLQRENAIQITTEESSVSCGTTPVEQDIAVEYQQNTGEFHDSVVLSEHPR